MNDEPKAIDLNDAAGDFVAGDLSDDDRMLFTERCASDDELQKECRFWESLRDEMHEHGRDPLAHVPGPGLAQAVRRRLNEDKEPRRQVKPIQFVPWLLAAAAILILIGQNINSGTDPSGSNQILGFTEDGAAIVNPEAAGPMQVSFRPTKTIAYTNQAAQSPLTETGARPWLGVWTEPVKISGLDDQNGALLVRQVTDGTAAAKAGIRPGDVLLSLGGCEVYSRWCISHALDDQPNDAPVQAEWYRPSSGERLTADLDLGCCWK